jgi:uncharacterized protein GlcG (DUF336 family)
MSLMIRSLPALTLSGAQRLAEVAEAEATRRGWTVAIAVVDPAGDLILFHRIDATQPASAELAVQKARTAARLRRATKVLEEGIANGRPALATIRQALALEGGLPIFREGHVVGAIGVSGMTSAEDGVIAETALRGFADS